MTRAIQLPYRAPLNTNIVQYQIFSNIAFLLISNDLCEYEFCKSLKIISEKKNIDLSSLYKYIKSDKYITIGGKNPGRKNSINEDGFSIYPISLIYYEIYS